MYRKEIKVLDATIRDGGLIIPYVISGMMNEHPRAAMALRKSEEKEITASFMKKFRVHIWINAENTWKNLS